MEGVCGGVCAGGVWGLQGLVSACMCLSCVGVCVCFVCLCV